MLRKGFYLFTYKLSLPNQKIESITPEEGILSKNESINKEEWSECFKKQQNT